MDAMNTKLLTLVQSITGRVASTTVPQTPLTQLSTLLQFKESLGLTPTDKQLVLEFSQSAHLIRDEPSLLVFNETMKDKVFVVGGYFTIADLFGYVALHPLIAKQPTPQRLQTPNTTRYFDLNQNIVHDQLAVPSSTPSLRFLDVDTEAPEEVRVVEEKKVKGAVAVAENAKRVAGNAVMSGDAVKEGGMEGKSESGVIGKLRKEKKAKAVQVATPAVVAEGPARIDLRVGKILSVTAHPDATTLYIEQIDLGEPQPRTVVSGLVAHYTPDQFEGKMVVVVCNLKPVKMRGVESSAMVLCASSVISSTTSTIVGEDGVEVESKVDVVKVELVAVPEGAKAGDKVWFEGFEGVADVLLKPKEKVWEGHQVRFMTDGNGLCGYKKEDGSVAKMVTEGGVCCVKDAVNGIMK